MAYTIIPAGASGSISGQEHDLLAGLTDDDHTQYFLLAGRAGGQTGVGGTGSGEHLTLNSTAHATKGQIRIGGASGIVWDEALLTAAVGGAPIASRHFIIRGTADMDGGIINIGSIASNATWSVGTNTTAVVRLKGYGSSHAGNTTYGEPTAGLCEISTTSLTKMAFLTGTTILQAIIDNGKPGISVVPTGVQRCWVGGVLKTIQSDTGNVTTGEDDLHSYTIPASVLSADGQSIEVEAVVACAANANNKQVRLKYGATTIADSGVVAQNGGSMVLRARITRTAAATQRALGTVQAAAHVASLYTTPAETLSGTVVLKLTGEGTSTDDLISKVTVIKWAPALN
jgi:hypothetical protein